MFKIIYDTSTILDKLCWYLFIALYKMSRRLGDNYKLKLYKHRKEALLSNGLKGYKLSADEAGLKPGSIMASYEKAPGKKTIYIGEIDQDGFIYPYQELFAGAPTVPREKFMERIKHKIFLVICDGFIGIEKHFRNRQRFLNEFVALINLNKAGFNVPVVLDVNFDTLTLTVSYIRGKVLREELAKKGALIRDSQMGYIIDYPIDTKKEYDQKIIEEGLKVMNQVIDREYIERLHKQIIRIHEKGFFIGDIKYGNIIIEETRGEPYFIDFEGSIQLSRIKCRRAREILKQKDIDRFAKNFGVEKSQIAD